MKILLKVIGTGVAATLLGYSVVPAVAASPSQGEAAPLSAEQLGTHVRIGTVLSVIPTHMVIVCRHKGKTAQLELELNGVTVQKGPISVGSQVAVHYRTQDNRNFATSIQLRKSLDETGSEPSQH